MMFAAKPAWSREIGPKWLERNYRKIEQMVPMRDGKCLYTAIYMPRDNGRHPVILMRTPYGLNPYGKGFASSLRTAHGIYAENRYIIVYQNVRGTYLSEGEMEQIHPVAEGGIDDATDTYDTAEWLVSNLPTNGNIGVLGVSYNGFYATVAVFSGHPAIKAVSPQAPIADWYIGDDAHMNGIFQNGIYSFGGGVFRHRKKPTNKSMKSLATVEGDCYDWFLSKGSLDSLLSPMLDSLKFMRQLTEHPHYDEFWKSRNPAIKFKDIKPAMMVVGGWFDAEDCYGTFETYRKICSLSPATESYLVAAPWYHGGWNKYNFDHIGDAWFGKNLSRHYMAEIEYPFFAYYLEGKGSRPAKVTVFPSAETMKEVTENADTEKGWSSYECWPPAAAISSRLYLGSGETLSYEEGDGDSWTYVSDPRHPVPFMENTEDGLSRDFMTADQRYAVRRTDMLVFAGEVLKEPVQMAGPIKAALKVSMNTTDADLVVKVVDVRPDGKHILIRHGAIPARYRKSLSEPVPMIPGETETISLELFDVNHIFLPGHRIEVLVMSSMFPHQAMSPQTFLPNIYKAKTEDYRKAEITVHSGSYIEFMQL